MNDPRKIPQAAPLPPDLVSPEDLKSLPPEQIQPEVDLIGAPPPSLGQRALLSIRAMADTDVRALMSSKRGNKRRALAVCLAFPVAIGLVLFVIGGEGRIKEQAKHMLASPISQGGNIETKIKRDAAELAQIKAELAAPKPPPKDAKSATNPAVAPKAPKAP